MGILPDAMQPVPLLASALEGRKDVHFFRTVVRPGQQGSNELLPGPVDPDILAAPG
jgi:hypothetical protein